MTLYSQNIYLAPYDHLIGKVITEYDIKKANISILYWKGVISRDEYNRLYGLEKNIREKVVGKMIKENKNIYSTIRDGILEAKEMFFKANNIQDDEVLSIKNDAVFLINKNAKSNSFPVVDNLSIEFIPKNKYSSFYYFKIKGVLSQEVYYYYNEISGNEAIDVKGIKDKQLEWHKDYFLKFLTDVFYIVQCKSLPEAISLIERYYLDYINGRLDIGHYRKFDSRSFYEVSTAFSTFETLMPMSYEIINPRHNLDIIRLLYKMISRDILSTKGNRRY